MKHSILFAALLVAAAAFATDAPRTPCDVNGDGQIDKLDIVIIMQSIGYLPIPDDPRDPNKDGVISIVDVRMCTLRCTKNRCEV